MSKSDVQINLRSRSKLAPLVSEHGEAVAVMNWKGMRLGRLPELALLYHIANEGSGSKWQGVRRKQEGLLAGMPDYCLPVARQGCHAWYGELKRNGETPRENQWRVIELLRCAGNWVDVCVGAQAMITALEKYLGVPPEERTELFT